MPTTHPPITIRPARPTDLSPVDELLSRSYPALLKADYAPSVLVTALPIISTARPSLMASGTYYLLEEEGELRAAGGWTRSDPFGGAGNGDIGHVRHVVTCKDHQRRGLARLLMAHAIHAAQEDGIRQLECYSTLTARAFYGAMGFEEVADITMTLRPGIAFPAVHMRMVLAH